MRLLKRCINAYDTICRGNNTLTTNIVIEFSCTRGQFSLTILEN